MFEIISAAFIGLGLFLLGMKYLTEGLNRFASSRFKYLIVNMKINPVLGVLIGAIITAILQSSSGTTVMVVGLVQANLLTLYQATPIIMGANIGTTMTSQLIAFNIQKYAFIPFLIGILANLAFKNKKLRYIGEVLIGFSLIFIGIDILASGLSPLKDIMGFQKILEEFGRNPILGILLGFSTISILQSSGTGIAILQTLSINGAVSIYSAVSIMLGMNVGTCVTTIISSLSLSRVAKQAAFVHFLFNIIGVLLVFPFINLLCSISVSLSPFNPARQIANANTIFNVFITLIILPFTNVLVNTAQLIIKKR